MTPTPTVGDIWQWWQTTSYVLISVRESSTENCHNFKAFNLRQNNFQIISFNETNINRWRKLA